MNSIHDGKVSVIVPVYNAKAYLRNTVKSILSQSYSNYEIILVNDGSTDGSGELCDNYASQYKHIKVIHQLNGGVSAARNAGLNNATGEYILFVDADDLIAEDMLGTLVDLIIQHNADISLVNIKKVYNVEDIASVVSERQIATFDGLGFLEQILKIKLFNIGACAKLYKHSIAKDIRFEVGKNINEDVYFLIRHALQVNKAVFDSRYKYFYIAREGSASNVGFHSAYMSILYYIDKIQKEVTEVYGESIKEALNVYVISNYFNFLNIIIYSGGKRCYPEEYRLIRKRISNYTNMLSSKALRKNKILSVLFLCFPCIYIGMLKIFKRKNFKRERNIN
jgi:glycosyltransferase involved in cell wall biosynthesis